MKIEVLYNEVANLFGDTANLRYLKKALPKAKFIYTSLNDKPKFISEDVSLVYMGPMSEKSQELVISRLANYKKEIELAIKNGINFLVTGNALEVFGKYIKEEDKYIEGLGIFDLYTERNMYKRYNSLELGKFKKIEIVGFRSSFTQVYSNEKPFLKMERGVGNSFDSNIEGVYKNNFIGTSLLGPILILNPYLVEYLFEKMGVKGKILLADELKEAYYKRLEEFKDQNRNID